MDELLGDFLTETAENLDLLDVELVRFEQEPNNAAMLNTIFQLVHTVKGTRGFLGLPRLAKLAHAAETLMGQYRDGAPVTAEGVTLILESIDRIKQILSDLDRHGTEPVHGELYDSIVDQGGDVLRLERSTYEANPVNLDAGWASVCAGVHRLETGLMVVLDVDKVLDLGRFRVAA
jgi:chemotaxis protein histidine kinase CheA